MNISDDQVRTGISEQAGEWFVTNEEGPLDTRESAALAAWLRASPAHIEEFLGVSAIARDLKAASTDPAYSLEAILARAREDGAAGAANRGPVSRPWFVPAMALAACVVLSLGLFLMWDTRPVEQLPAEVVATLHFETSHGQQLTRVLADHSVLHLNTDSAVDIRYDSHERHALLLAGQASFEVTHEPGRAFRVIAGATQVVDLGTQFDVHLEPGATVITVIEGRVGVAPANSPQGQSIPMRAGQQLRVSEGEWPVAPTAVDAQRATAWLRREIVFDHEPLENVAAEYNRYTSKPIEIATPALRGLQITGVFATDDPDSFIAFLRSLKAVRVEVSETQIRVSRN
jgi:transmembrane sensor